MTETYKPHAPDKFEERIGTLADMLGAISVNLSNSVGLRDENKQELVDSREQIRRELEELTQLQRA